MSIALNGISSIWEEIKPDLIIKTRRHCGTYFPLESIDKGKNMDCRLDYLSMYVANQIITIDHDCCFRGVTISGYLVAFNPLASSADPHIK